jgi:hypothetical protein
MRPFFHKPLSLLIPLLGLGFASCLLSQALSAQIVTDEPPVSFGLLEKQDTFVPLQGTTWKLVAFVSKYTTLVVLQNQNIVKGSIYHTCGIAQSPPLPYLCSRI